MKIEINEDQNIYDLLQNKYVEFLSKITAHPKVKAFDIDEMSGGFELIFKDIDSHAVLATPFWGGENVIPIVVVNVIEVDFVSSCNKPIPKYLEKLKDYNTFSNWYYKEIDKIYKITKNLIGN